MNHSFGVAWMFLFVLFCSALTVSCSQASSSCIEKNVIFKVDTVDGTKQWVKKAIYIPSCPTAETQKHFKNQFKKRK